MVLGCILGPCFANMTKTRKGGVPITTVQGGLYNLNHLKSTLGEYILTPANLCLKIQTTNNLNDIRINLTSEQLALNGPADSLVVIHAKCKIGYVP